MTDLLSDAVAVYEEILDREDMDYEECSAMADGALCGSTWCDQCGCIVDKRARALAAQNPCPLPTPVRIDP